MPSGRHDWPVVAVASSSGKKRLSMVFMVSSFMFQVSSFRIKASGFLNFTTGFVETIINPKVRKIVEYNYKTGK
jgi:hypothetical protein